MTSEQRQLQNFDVYEVLGNQHRHKAEVLHGKLQTEMRRVERRWLYHGCVCKSRVLSEPNLPVCSTSAICKPIDDKRSSAMDHPKALCRPSLLKRCLCCETVQNRHGCHKDHPAFYTSSLDKALHYASVHLTDPQLVPVVLCSLISMGKFAMSGEMGTHSRPGPEFHTVVKHKYDEILVRFVVWVLSRCS